MSIADDARALVARSRAAQGLPETVIDTTVLTKVAAIVLAATNGNAGPHDKAGVANTISMTTTVLKSGGSDRWYLTPTSSRCAPEHSIERRIGAGSLSTSSQRRLERH